MIDALIAGRVHGQPTLRAQVLALRHRKSVHMTTAPALNARTP